MSSLVGLEVEKVFPGYGLFRVREHTSMHAHFSSGSQGTISSYHAKRNLVMIDYEDGDSEEMTLGDAKALLIQSTDNDVKYQGRALARSKGSISPKTTGNKSKPASKKKPNFYYEQVEESTANSSTLANDNALTLTQHLSELSSQASGNFRARLFPLELRLIL